MAIITPFRYPGSKNKILPVIGQHLYPLVEKKSFYFDGFVGGGSVLLDIATKFPDKKLIANDLDFGVSQFWNLMGNSFEWEISQLKNMLACKPTVDMYYHLRNLKEAPIYSRIDAAFRALFFNRTSFSGDMRRGASPIGGRHQKSKYTVDCRYNADKLIDKIERIHELLRGRLVVESRDILATDHIENDDMAAYLDPPYFVAGKMLYEQGMKTEDHRKLADKLKGRTNWVLSYDNAPQITALYDWAEIQPVDVKYCIKGEKTSWDETKEILILPK